MRGPPLDAWAKFAGLIQMLAPHFPPPSGKVETRNGDVDGIGYRIYTPKEHDGSLPLVIFTHGGGFILGDLESEDILCRMVAEHSKMAVVSIDYRLSPEMKAPAHVDDCWKVYKWAHENAASFGASSKKTYTMGGSAGGALALGLARRAIRDQTYKSSLKGIIALVPVTTHRDNVPSKYRALHDEHYYKDAAFAPIIDEESVNMCFVQAGLDMNDRDYFVLLAEEDHASFPPTYIMSCECDPLRADSFAIKKAFEDAGVKVKHDDIPSMPHYFWIFPQLEESQTFGAKVLAGLEWVKAQS